ncbi:MAG TPA: VOC family protein [Bryobacteraceae bacterium]|nr:VOC family protein [Bryobacteraceae bacterium]
MHFRRTVQNAVRVALLLAGMLGAGSLKPIATGVDSIGLTVSDLDRSVEFYSKVLTFEKVSEVEVDGEPYEHLEGVFGLRMRIARMRLGDEYIELTEFLAPKGRPAPVDSKSNDTWFQHVAIITTDMDAAYQRLRRFHAQHASSGPQRLPDWNKNAGGIRAFYFRDPDGHPLEVLAFPPGKGNAKWHRASDELFLGIDHTAIVVSDTAASLRFYRDTLGFEVSGESENYGTEQEHLNNVFGARLHITSLRAASGPGVEFLEYLAPSDGRLYPKDEKPNDLVHWQTRVRAANPQEALARLRLAGAPLISSGLVELKPGRSAIVRDPDGHAVEIFE